MVAEGSTDLTDTMEQSIVAAADDEDEDEGENIKRSVKNLNLNQC